MNVIVIAPVIVAALGVIDAVNDHATGGREWSTSEQADKAKHYTIARGSAMESAAHLDVMRVDDPFTSAATITVSITIATRPIGLSLSCRPVRGA